MQYVETFHEKTGNSTTGYAPRTELAAQWHWDADSFKLNINSPIDEDFAVADDRDLTAFKTGAAKTAAFSIERADDSADTEVAASLTSLPAAAAFDSKFAMLVARASGAITAETAFIVGFQHETTGDTARARIYKAVGGVYTALQTSIPKAHDNAVVTLMRFQLLGNDLKARFWPQNEKEPSTWDVEITDASVPGAGWAGVGVFNPDANIVDPELDNVGFISVATDGSEAYIPVSRYERRRFLESSSKVSMVLCEAGVLGSPNGVDGVDSTVCMSSRGWVSGPGDVPSNQVYRGVIKSVGTFSQRMNEALQGRATQGFGTVTVRNSNRALDDWLRYNWDGRPFKILLGSPNWKRCDFMLVARGTIERVEQTAFNDIAFRLRDGSNLLARRIQENKVGGTGPDAERPIPLTFGRPFNCTPVLVDDTTHTYQYHDGAIDLLFDVREGGDSIIGSVVPDEANGKMALSANPQYAITCDPRRTTGGDSHHAIFLDMLFNYSQLSADQIRGTMPGTESFDTVESAGVYVGGDYKNVDELIEELSISQGGFSAWNRWGEIFGARLILDPEEDPIVFDLVEDDLINKKLMLKRLVLPGRAVEAWYKKNFTVQELGTLVGIVSEADKALFSKQATLWNALITGIGSLDLPEEHLLARQIDPLPTLFIDSSGVDDTFNEYANWYHTVGIFGFETKRRAMEMEIGWRVRLTHSAYGFDDGAVGVIVGMDKNYRSRKTTVELAVQLTGRWPVVTAERPYV